MSGDSVGTPANLPSEERNRKESTEPPEKRDNDLELGMKHSAEQEEWDPAFIEPCEMDWGTTTRKQIDSYVKYWTDDWREREFHDILLLEAFQTSFATFNEQVFNKVSGARKASLIETLRRGGIHRDDHQEALVTQPVRDP